MHSERLSSFNSDSEVTIAPACSWEESWTLSDVLVVLTKGSPWMSLARSSISWLQSLTGLLALNQTAACHQGDRMLPRLTGRGHARCPRNPDSCSPWPLPAGLLSTWDNRTQKAKCPKLGLPPFFTSCPGPPETHLNSPLGPECPAPALLQAAALPWGHSVPHRLRARACQQSSAHRVLPDPAPITRLPIPCAGNAVDFCLISFFPCHLLFIKHNIHQRTANKNFVDPTGLS